MKLTPVLTLIAIGLALGVGYIGYSYARHRTAIAMLELRLASNDECVRDWHDSQSLTEDLKSINVKGLQELSSSSSVDGYELLRDLDRSRQSFIDVRMRMPSDEFKGTRALSRVGGGTSLNKLQVALGNVITDLNMIVPFQGDARMIQYTPVARMNDSETKSLISDLMNNASSYGEEAMNISSKLDMSGLRCEMNSDSEHKELQHLRSLNVWQVSTR